MARARRSVALPCPDVRFAPDYLGRLERLGARLSAARQRREGGGAARLAGGGEEFVGYRPYRAGEDLRQLDWDLFARLDRPYVRISRREAAELWTIHVDASASMGVGPPGKLQKVAEVAGAIASLALRGRAEAQIVVGVDGGVAEFQARRLTDLPSLIAFLEGLEAGGSEGLRGALARRPPAASSGRRFLLGDLLDLEPGAVARLCSAGSEVFCAQVLAPFELQPVPGTPVEWMDAEGEGALPVDLTSEVVADYERRLEKKLETWARVVSSHGVRFNCTASDHPFEEIVRRLLGA